MRVQSYVICCKNHFLRISCSLSFFTKNNTNHNIHAKWSYYMHQTPTIQYTTYSQKNCLAMFPSHLSFQVVACWDTNKPLTSSTNCFSHNGFKHLFKLLRSSKHHHFSMKRFMNIMQSYFESIKIHLPNMHILILSTGLIFSSKCTHLRIKTAICSDITDSKSIYFFTEYLSF